MLTGQIPQNAYMNRYVIVVDDDINPTSRADVLWAICTRVHPPRDIHTVDRTLGSRLDPIPYDDEDEMPEGGGQYNARAVIDATRAWEDRDEFPPVAEISDDLKAQVLDEWSHLFDHFDPV
jgi:3-polyprenyl-4-hydroxybenzoate decarboxylase